MSSHLAIFFFSPPFLQNWGIESGTLGNGIQPSTLLMRLMVFPTWKFPNFDFWHVKKSSRLSVFCLSLKASCRNDASSPELQWDPPPHKFGCCLLAVKKAQSPALDAHAIFPHICSHPTCEDSPAAWLRLLPPSLRVCLSYLDPSVSSSSMEPSHWVLP